MAILTMLQLRPYVFGFLVAFLFLSIRHWGIHRTLLWMVMGYAIALASEAISIRTGFPYGWYFYKYDNLTQDILVLGVPIWDSLSYTFLIFAGYTTVQYRWPRLSPAATAILGGAATMLLDIMIDPVSNLGERWFLGSIYYYPTGGAHFGVPVSNYIGWFFVSWLVISFFQRITPSGNKHPLSALYPLFYLAIGAFNTAIAFWIDAPMIGAANTAILLAAAVVLFRKQKATPIILAILAGIAVSFSSFAKSDLPKFKEGDLVFLDLNCGKLCDAIEDSTLKQFNVQGPRLSHVCILHKERTQWMVVEAWDGVQETPLDVFLTRSGDRGWYWGRVKTSDKIRKAAVAEALKRLGQPYDATFKKDNGSFYCSELVADAYNDAAQKTIFDYLPMTFGNPNNPKDTTAATWRDYFKQHKQAPPAGEPGISPLGIYLSPVVERYGLNSL